MALKKQLDTPFLVSAEIYYIKLNSLFVDISEQQAHFGYSIIKQDGNVFQSDLPSTISGADFTDFTARMNELGATLDANIAVRQAALEYAPGVGTISGDTKTLNTPYSIDGNVIGLDVDSYGFNSDDKIVYIGYSQLDTVTHALVSDVPWTLTGVEYDEFIARANELENTYSVTQATIATCLEFLPGEGTIINV